VLRGTGVGLASWQAGATGVREASLGEWNFAVVLLDPPREHLRTAIGARFAEMVRNGAIEEVEALMALRLDPRLPAMRALGVRQLSSYLRGEITIEQAVKLASVATGQYAKRQATWFRHQRLGRPEYTHTIHAPYSGGTQCLERISGNLENFLYTAG
jgi:tRNA dimethylallyltransferase